MYLCILRLQHGRTIICFETCFHRSKVEKYVLMLICFSPVRNKLTLELYHFQISSTREVIPEAGDIETIHVPIEARVVVRHPASVDTLSGTQVTSVSTTNSPVKNLLVEGAFEDEPQLPEEPVDKKPPRKRGKLSE